MASRTGTMGTMPVAGKFRLFSIGALGIMACGEGSKS